MIVLFSRLRRFTILGVLGLSLALLLQNLSVSRAEDASDVESRLLTTIKYLSSDELEGRGVGTAGLDLAADFIAKQFREAGLKVDLYDGSAFQKFKLTTGARLGDGNRLEFVGPASAGTPAETIKLKVGETFNPLTMGGSGKFDLPVVFVGYGITGKNEKYDDYAGIDVKDKAVIILRHEPQQDNPHSVFAGTEISPHAPYKRKISNAYEHGAAAVIFCTDEFELQRTLTTARNRWQAAVDKLAKANEEFKAIAKPTLAEWQAHQEAVKTHIAEVERLAEPLAQPRDPLVPVNAAGPDADGRDFPVIFCQRKAIEQIIEASLGKSLTQIEAEIDKGPAPQSRELVGWHITGETNIRRQESEVKNVIGVLEGEGPHANETIVFGAHYDHLGYGGEGSLAPGSRAIHNGADDNGSGTTVLLEVARRMAALGKPKHRMVFIAFTGEERGLIGSARYVRDPLYPMDSTIAMINMDMVGRLTNEKLTIYGTSSAKGFEQLIDKQTADTGLKITKEGVGPGNSDHASFYAAKVPVLFLFTNTHRDYHRPSDDWDKLNIAGMRRITDLVVNLAVEIDSAPERPKFVESGGPAPVAGGGGDRPYFGSIPDFAQDQPGYVLMGVTAGGPAEKAGIKAGDTILKVGDSRIGNLEDFDSALRKFAAGDKVPVIVKRDGEEVKVEVTLEPPR